MEGLMHMLLNVLSHL